MFGIQWAIVMVSALVGAGILYWRCQHSGFSTQVGTWLGAGAGALGSLVFMLPLDFCTFEEGRSGLDQVVGLGLVAIGVGIPVLSLDWWIRRREAKARGLIREEFQQGVFRNSVLAWIFLAPTLVILALFLYYPGLDTLRLSTLLTFVGAPRSRFVCMDNFTALVGDASYLRSLSVTFFISFAIVILGLASSLLIALLVQQPIRGAALYRTFLIWPYAISPAVAGIIFFIIFNPLGGIFNHFLNTTGLAQLLALAGIPRLNWLSNPNLAPWVVILASVWKQMGYNILFYIAGLQNLPHNLQEAAAIDGAGAIRRFFTITVPLLSPITFFLVVTNMTYAFFDIFGTIDLLTAGGPSRSTSVLIYKIYEIGVSAGNLGQAAAQSIILFILVVGLTILQFANEKKVNYNA
jgi:sn-glycerol 3-phosphate transport system permease protein